MTLIRESLRREKQSKIWNRLGKFALIEKDNRFGVRNHADWILIFLATSLVMDHRKSVR